MDLTLYVAFFVVLVTKGLQGQGIQGNSFASAPNNIVRIRTMDVAKHIFGLV